MTDTTRVQLNPTWEAATMIYVAVLQNPNATISAKRSAEEELLRLARAYDEVTA